MKGTYGTEAENYGTNKEDRKRGEAMRAGASWERKVQSGWGAVVRRAQGAGEASSGPDPSRCCGVSSSQNTWPDRPELPSPLAHFSLPFSGPLLPLK